MLDVPKIDELLWLPVCVPVGLPEVAAEPGVGNVTLGNGWVVTEPELIPGVPDALALEDVPPTLELDMPLELEVDRLPGVEVDALPGVEVAVEPDPEAERFPEPGDGADAAEPAGAPGVAKVEPGEAAALPLAVAPDEGDVAEPDDWALSPSAAANRTEVPQMRVLAWYFMDGCDQR